MLDPEEKRRRKEEIRATVARARALQDDEDYEAVIVRNEENGQAMAVNDILLSRRLPFLVKNEMKMAEEDSIEASASVELRSRGSSSLNRSTSIASKRYQLPSLGASSKLGKSKAIGSASSSSLNQSVQDGKGQLGVVHPKKLHSLMTDIARAMIDPDRENENMKRGSVNSSTKGQIKRTADGQLQYVLELLNQVKTSLEPSKLYFEAGVIFYTMNVHERAVVCLEKATLVTDAARIIDTNYLPIDVHYQRKVERMSPTMLPKFLQERAMLRDTLIFQESERQRLRARAAHCELTRLYALVEPVRDVWKAHAHLQCAFQICANDEEHADMLRYFHRLLVVFSLDVLMEGTEFPLNKQIIRKSAGPLSDAHVNILQSLEVLEPRNAVYQDWLGMRFTEKCQFDEAQRHYETARNIRRARPDRAETIALWRKKPAALEEDNEAMQEAIRKNIHKSVLRSYHNADEAGSSVGNEQKDLSWFEGTHQDQHTFLYLPPPQGWTGQSK